MSDLNTVLKIKERREESHDCQTIVFEKPRAFGYKSGQWLDIRFPTEEFPVGRTFSFSSSPTETDLLVTFKKGLSKFKKQMESVVPEETMLITQYGGEFFLKPHYSVVLIAGGVGIAPFRSMIKEFVDYKDKTEITLIYLNHTEDFPFKKELVTWEKENPSLKVHFIETGKEGRLTKERLKQIIPTQNDNRPNFYVAGPPALVKNTEKMLSEIGVSKDNLETESFDGYD